MAKRRYIATWVDPRTGKRRTKDCPTAALRDKLQAEMRKRAWMIREGLVTTRQLDVADAVSMPIRSLLDEWVVELERRRRTQTSVKESDRCATKVFHEAGIRYVGDIRAEPIVRWLQALALADRSPRTQNVYLRTAKAVCAFAVRTDRLLENPLAHVDQVEDASRARPRRPMTVSEFRLLEGSKRWQDYLLLVRTGLRWTEASSLQFSNVDLEARTLTVPKGIGKTDWGLNCVLPLSDDVVEQLRNRRRVGKVPLLRYAKPTPKVWRNEIARAGIKLETNEGLCFSSSMRPTFCTWLAESGAGIDTIMRLRRDRGPLAEARYVERSRLFDQLRSAVDRMVAWYADDDREREVSA